MIKYYLYKTFHNLVLFTLTAITVIFTFLMLAMEGQNQFIELLICFITLVFDAVVVLVTVELDEIFNRAERQMRYN